MRNKKSTELDGISTFLLKKVWFVHDRTPTWKHEHIIKNGTFLSCLKEILVKPIPKKGPMYEVNNYHPITLVTVLFNVLDKIISNWPVKCLKKTAILGSVQFGFGKLTKDAITSVTGRISENLGNKTSSCVLSVSKVSECTENKIQY
jgi:hypothetical protein